ncbi:MAG: hypothetical protein HFE94_07440 [Acutalibacter sp.]|nr:hypothetical protein [Acutalibacter sp.]
MTHISPLFHIDNRRTRGTVLQQKVLRGGKYPGDIIPHKLRNVHPIFLLLRNFPENIPISGKTVYNKGSVWTGLFDSSICLEKRRWPVGKW